MENREIISSYVNSLFYAVTRPDISHLIASSFNIDSMQETDTSTKLLTMGALFVARKFEEFSLLIPKLDFSDITQEQRFFLADSVFSLFSNVLLSDPFDGAHRARVILQLLLAIAPDKIMPHKRQSELSQRHPLLQLDYAQSTNNSVRGVIFSREFVWGAGSRKYELGFRLQSALSTQGWSVSFSPVQNIVNYSSSGIDDFAMVDSILFAQEVTYEKTCEILSNLKRYFRKLIIIEPDPWTGLHDEKLLAVSSHVDYIWGFTNDWGLIENPVFKNRSLLFPGIGGYDHLENIKHSDLSWSSCTFNFTGSVMGFNMNRAYWILESISRKLPINIKVTTPEVDDGLSHEESLKIYAQLLASTHASLNLTTREDGSQRITGRPTEILSLNRLLIQENCPAFHSYYVEGEHFLEFSDIEGLGNIIDFLRSHPRVAQKICSEGHQFYLERYSCRKLVEHIQTWL